MRRDRGVNAPAVDHVLARSADERSRVPGHAEASGGRRTARSGAPLRRPARTRSLAYPPVVPSRPGDIPEQGPSRAHCSAAGQEARPTQFSALGLMPTKDPRRYHWQLFLWLVTVGRPMRWVARELYNPETAADGLELMIVPVARL